MKDEELRDELMTLLVAGHETTATALTWALYWIHKLPEVRQKLLAELDILGDTPDQNAIVRLPYLNAICSETLRIYPVGMLTFPRVVRSPVTLLGQQLEPGTVLVGSIYLAHQRQDLYPEPKQFKPERFLERQFSPYEYLPFGGGVRHDDPRARDKTVTGGKGANLVEMAGIGLPVPPGFTGSFSDYLRSQNYRFAPLGWDEAEHANRLPMHHADPMDRMLIATAIVRGPTIVTSDSTFAAYGVPTIW